jgi:hypothetical protein
VHRRQDEGKEHKRSDDCMARPAVAMLIEVTESPLLNDNDDAAAEADNQPADRALPHSVKSGRSTPCSHMQGV